MKHYISRIFTFVLAISSLILNSCSDKTSPREAVYTQLDQLVKSPGFEWFTPEYNGYQPDAATINKIKTKIQGKSLTYILFVNPSCACTGTQKQFPQAIKALKESGISEPNFKIYTFITPQDMHPFMNKFKVEKLPCLFPVQDSIPGFSVIDSLDKYKILEPDSNHTIEEYLLKSLN